MRESAAMATSGRVSADREWVLARLAGLRLHQRDGRRSPHKPLLVLLALGRLANTGSSALPWTQAQVQLADVLAEFGPASRTSRSQSAAYPFTRLRSDFIWMLDHDVPMDKVGPLTAWQVTGSFTPQVERILADDPGLVASAARALVDSHFPDTVAADVLAAVGLVNWLKTRVRCPSVTMSVSCSTSRSSLVEATARCWSSTNATSRLACRNNVSERKISNRFFSRSPSRPSTFCRSRCR
jgi:hypothetical protein